MKLNRIENQIIEAIGTIYSLILHLIWFALWFIIKLDINVLTMLVSLEAIFLSIFIQMNVNRHHRHTIRKGHK